MTPDLYAYSLRNQEPGWAWHVYDIDGRLVASGLENTQKAAALAIERIIPHPEPAEPSQLVRYS